jgi:Family of unknown function (DUF5317)
VRLVLLVLLIAIGIGFLAGGRLSALSGLHIRWAPLAVVGFAMQIASPAGRWSMPILIVSFVLLTIFGIVNLKVPGFALILAGIVMNFLVIGINGGMPVERYALTGSGQADTLTLLVDEGGAKHHLATDDDQLLFLADVVPIAPPIRQAVSAGDIVAYTGVAYVIVAGMRRDRRRREAPDRPLEAEGAPGV